MPGGQYTAKDQFFNVLWLQARARQRRFRRHGAESRGGEILEIPLKTADGGAGGGHDDDRIGFGHG